MKQQLKYSILGLAAVVAINVLASYVYHRFDLTEDKRYTLSEAALQTVANFKSPIVVDVLLEGNLPAEFSRLKTETILLLEQFRAENRKITFNLIDPKEGIDNPEEFMAQMQQLGLKPVNVTLSEDGKTSQEIIFPWAMVNSGNQTVKVPLLKNKLGATPEERINNSVQQLEYAFADAFTKIGIKDKKKIAVLKGNGELEDQYMADFLTSIRDYYNIGAITLDSVAANPNRVLDQLKTFDLALVAKPTQAFTEEEKYVLDQYIVQGGKSLWLVDQVAMEIDSLYNENGSNIALKRELNLDDFFFKYGIRVNPVLVNDLYNTPIVLATGSSTDSQYNPLPWVYNPMVFSRENHPINKNIEAVRFQFANGIDILNTGARKTVLLASSPLSKTEGSPKTISLDILAQTPNEKQYEQNAGTPLAVLIEGEFNSAYTNRVKPVKLTNAAEKGARNKMIVIADGDLIKNQLRNGLPLELGYDKWTNSFYGNKEFLTNCVNYLLDDTGLINIRNKKVAIPLLDPQKISEQKSKWQLINILLPILLVVLLGISYGWYRKQNYKA
ncbi:gliding motility-associated ABC transporter substrate-binding protein GldG [Flavobacterium sp. ASW18X]|uniref:gliding motility-associated ABC transporter substrate-binding protein GldG n=1 Tax=Flavobacterium sp. ASW18X TaxID=2572595 RepID=UPI0010AE01D2|nr:gliding motility-associated ABC transporter substrate-binding protein GldG [Flavobacterium sp. ASW18X]TKD66281.1 gliding motility-associated ABC transporter substrate-binding protein GldG [Flavobacterium sp. ASW18X]